ncbi:type IV toxin-antitoxin system AbiEi family antitoxin domain-containing protein [Micromonospora chokoriensis]
MVTLDQALRAGLTRDELRHLCRSGRWQRLLRGCFVPNAELGDSTRRRARIRAAVVSLGPGAFVVLDTALELHGIAGLRRTAQVHVSVPADRPRHQRHPVPWLTVHQMTADPGEITEVAGIRVTAPLRTVSSRRSPGRSLSGGLGPRLGAESTAHRPISTDGDPEPHPRAARRRRGTGLPC